MPVGSKGHQYANEVNKMDTSYACYSLVYSLTHPSRVNLGAPHPTDEGSCLSTTLAKPHGSCFSTWYHCWYLGLSHYPRSTYMPAYLATSSLEVFWLAGWLVGTKDPMFSCLSMRISLGTAFLHLVLMASLILANGIVAILILARAWTCLCILFVFISCSGSQEHVWVYLPEAERLLGTEPYCPNQSLPRLGISMSIKFKCGCFVSEQSLIVGCCVFYTF